MAGMNCVLPLLFVLIGGAFSQRMSGSGGSGLPMCTELPRESLCSTRAVGRNSNYSFPQNIPGLFIDPRSVRLTFALLNTLSPPPHPACTDAFFHVVCGGANPPCDPSTQRILPICNDSCRAYKQLLSDGICNDLSTFLSNFAGADPVANAQVYADLYDNLDCDNVSTYYFGSYPDLVSQDKCTDIISPALRDSILNSARRCEVIPAGTCTVVATATHYFPNSGRLDTTTIFSALSALNATLDSFCSEALFIIVCSYAYPECNPQTRAQVLVCEDVCPLISIVQQRCRSVFDELAFSAPTQFRNFLSNFNCSNSSTYAIPGIPTDQKCENFSRILSELATEVPTAAANSTAVVAGSVTAAVGALLILVGVALLTVGIFIKRKRMKQFLLTPELTLREMRPQYTFSHKYSLQPGDEETTVTACALNEMDREQYETLFSDVLISYELLEIGESIGEGAFGIVYRGTLMQPADPETKKDVAIKTIKNLISDDEVKAFFAESLLMKDFNHAHILGLLGVCFDTPDSSPYIVLPFMANGNMKDYLKSKRVHVTDVDTYPQGVERQVLVQMCIDIAEGMEYLAEQRFVHRDLAARNCMVADDLRIKVGDFGLARDVYSASYYRVQRRTRLPVKWMPPETLHDGISNEKTDVWSFGVTCWEAFSLGRTPYPGIENHEILDHITKGGRLQKPTLCQDKMYELITSCWLLNPEDRPSFSDLVVRLKDYWDNEHFYVVQNFSAS